MSEGKYRSIFQSPMPPSDGFRAARDEMRTWLRDKSYDLEAFDRGDPRVGGRAVLLHSAANSADGAQTERWHLRESRDEGSWISLLTVHATADASRITSIWFWVEVEFVPNGSGQETTAHVRASVPRLARGLLTAVPAFDSLAMLTEAPSMVSLERVDELIDVLCDPERRLPTVVASAHPTCGFEDWKSIIERATWSLTGLASLYLLDPLATAEFNASIGQTHAVWGGALRTYLPDVDPAVPSDALRHRVLSAAGIADDPSRAAGILSSLPRRLAVEAPLPKALAGVNRSLLTQARGTPDADDLEGLRAQLTQLGEERDIALNLAEEQEGRANVLFGDRRSLLAELSEREQQVLQLDTQVRALRRRLVEAGRYDDAFSPAEEPVAAPPDTFAGLLDWLDTELSMVEYTGDLEAPLSLDQSPEAYSWVRSSWDVLRALQSYAEAKAARTFAGDFKTWCETPPPEAYAVPAGKVARDESQTVRNNPKWRREREFPVPKAVCASGTLFMGSHVRVGASAAGQISPRLYFYDAIAQTGMIYVGYLGRHLTNTRT